MKCFLVPLAAVRSVRRAAFPAAGRPATVRRASGTAGAAGGGMLGNTARSVLVCIAAAAPVLPQPVSDRTVPGSSNAALVPASPGSAPSSPLSFAALLLPFGVVSGVGGASASVFPLSGDTFLSPDRGNERFPETAVALWEGLPIPDGGGDESDASGGEPTVSVPAPAALAMFGLAVAALLVTRRRRSRSSRS